MFQFPAFPPSPLYIQGGVTKVCLAGLPHSEIQEFKRLLTTPLGLSQPAASFIGSTCLGIPRVLLLASYTLRITFARRIYFLSRLLFQLLSFVQSQTLRSVIPLISTSSLIF